MKNILIGVMVGAGIAVAGSVFALSTLQVVQGGTGATTLTGCLTGNGTGPITGSGTCGSSFPWPFTKLGTGEQATSTIMSWLGGFTAQASSTIARFTAGNSTTTGTTVSGDIGGVYLSAAGSGVGGIGFNSIPDGGYNAGVTGYGALFQLAPSTGGFTMFLESNVSGGVPHGHTQTLSWDNTGRVTLPQGLITTNASSTLFSSQYASTTILCLSNDCRTVWPSFTMSFAWPWTKQADNSQATSTVMAFLNGFESTASSTATSLVATSTNFNVSSNHVSFGSNYVNATSTLSLNVASSTIVNGTSYNRASTTLQFAPWLENRQIVGASCIATSTGGVLFQVGGKTKWTATLFCNGNPQTYTFTPIQVAAFSDFLNVTVASASSTADRASINVITQKVSD